MSAKELKQKSIPLTKEAKSSIFTVALTIFLDLVGFSIIFYKSHKLYHFF